MYKVKDKLKEARSANGFSQQQMANMLRIERSTYSSYEKGKTEPTYSIGMKIATILKVNPSWLLTDDAAPTYFRSDTIFDMAFEKRRKAKMGELEKEEREVVAYYRMFKLLGKDEDLMNFIKKELDEGEPEE